MMVSDWHYTRHFDSIKDCTVRCCLPIVSFKQGRVQHELLLLVELSERIRVRSRAETRSSIAQGLKEGVKARKIQ